MPGNAFIKFETQDGKSTPGESMQLSHPGTAGWLEISDWGFDIEAEASHLKGTGASVGKPNPGPLNFTHYYDKSSPTIMQMIVKGNHFKSVRIDMTKQTGDTKPQIFMQVILQEAFITKVGSKCNEDGTVEQEVEMVYKKIGTCYKPQKNDGKLGKEWLFRWDVTAGTTEGVSITFDMGK